MPILQPNLIAKQGGSLFYKTPYINSNIYETDTEIQNEKIQEAKKLAKTKIISPNAETSKQVVISANIINKAKQLAASKKSS